MRTNWRDHEHLELGIHDGPTAGERIRGGAGGARNHEAIAAVRVDKATVDPGFVVDETTDLTRLQHDVIQCETGLALTLRGGELGG